MIWMLICFAVVMVFIVLLGYRSQRPAIRIHCLYRDIGYVLYNSQAEYSNESRVKDGLEVFVREYLPKNPQSKSRFWFCWKDEWLLWGRTDSGESLMLKDRNVVACDFASISDAMEILKYNDYIHYALAKASEEHDLSDWQQSLAQRWPEEYFLTEFLQPGLMD